MPNTFRVIFPDKKNSVWMFDDDAVGLREKPFVSGAPEIIDVLVAGIENARLRAVLLRLAFPRL
jgi:hypothetical protein